MNDEDKLDVINSLMSLRRVMKHCDIEIHGGPDGDCWVYVDGVMVAMLAELTPSSIKDYVLEKL